MRIPAALFVILFSSLAWSQTTRPAESPAAPASPDPVLKRLLSPNRANAPLLPQPDAPTVDQTSRNAVAPRAEQQSLIREGSIIPDRVGRLTRTADGQPEFTFESDGQAMQDPPMIILPNLKLVQMENAVKTMGRELKFRITGMVTEYGSRNYVLIEKVVVAGTGTTVSPARDRDRERESNR